MDFGDVIKAVKSDPTKRFARRGWNGKGMFIYLTKGRDVPVDDWRGEPPCIANGDLITTENGVEYYQQVVRLTDHFDMKSADNTIVCGWLASQTDMLADDWYEVADDA